MRFFYIFVFMKTFKEILEYPLFSIHQYTLYVYELLGVAMMLCVAFLINKITKRILYKSTKIDKGTQYALHQIVYYLLIIITFIFSMRIIGIDISPLLVGSGAILVGIGLGLQNLFLDFISGVIILLERSIKVGDILDMDGVMGKIIKINMRTTQVLTTDQKIIILPNSNLTKNKLINYSSHYQGDNIFWIDISVNHTSDIELVINILVKVANKNPNVTTAQPPQVRLLNFGENTLDLRLYFSSRELFKIAKIKSDIRFSILEEFKKNNILFGKD